MTGDITTAKPDLDLRNPKHVHIVAIGGAVTSASRLVTCESVSVVTFIASSTSRRTSDSPSSSLRGASGSSRST